MASEMWAGLSIFKTMLDAAKGLKNINDAAVRNAAVVELQEKILAAQEQQTTLVMRVGNLEKQVADFEAWDREKKRYKLTDYGGGTFAYALKEEARDGEPAHRICATCYQRGQKSLLQFKFRSSAKQDVVHCFACSKDLFLGAPQRIEMPPLPDDDYERI